MSHYQDLQYAFIGDFIHRRTQKLCYLTMMVLTSINDDKNNNVIDTPLINLVIELARAIMKVFIN